MDPRVARSREVVLRAGADLIVEGGVRAFSVDAIAARTGVAKTTIYRHWPTRQALLNDVFQSFDSHSPTPDAGSLRADLRVILRGLAEELRHADWPKNLTAIVAEAEHDRELAEVHVVHVVHETSATREVLRRAQARGEIAADLDLPLVEDLVHGALFMRRLVLHSHNTQEEVDRLVDLLVDGLATRQEQP
jgi:AcrR family transcriptional regulator